MKTFYILFCIVFLCACNKETPSQPGNKVANPIITIRTNLGDIEVELLQNKAPETVQNFLQYAKDGHYTGTIFHRVIDGFMIQGGGYTADFKEKKTRSPVRNEADNRVSNKRGTLAMARTSDIHSATGQFFINVADNDFLNYRNPTPSGFGYCVFGEVTKGMDIVDKIKKVKTGSEKGHQDVPLQSIKILEVLVH